MCDDGQKPTKAMHLIYYQAGKTENWIECWYFKTSVFWCFITRTCSTLDSRRSAVWQKRQVYSWFSLIHLTFYDFVNLDVDCWLQISFFFSLSFVFSLENQFNDVSTPLQFFRHFTVRKLYTLFCCSNFYVLSCGNSSFYSVFIRNLLVKYY